MGADVLADDATKSESPLGSLVGSAQPAGVPDQDAVIAAIATVYDPEIPVNIYELGLIYAIDLHEDGRVSIEMTLTAPNCPSAQELPEQVREAVARVDGVTDATVEVVWDPPWDMSRMSDEARLALNMF
ncbi:SUF system Fe-S cluster assembly protein [Acidomonas methanolica]|uniref:Metal sulfur cluster biosynthetic enzyme n=2 Tax=Acidomonas methanolica TaxID=437 RepID=A0A023D5K4_ACIMT|nr:SUF system Fe-S cluster assembly protein [Acidomonas methanolica]GAJ29422.1 metal sulfur cluster biosynthetic enzyme [Acidomonas methanolica NBRC 104435]MBU2653151.1 SUF system Fe-S cluster assembly protein [Acidomonas methanolica]TCS32100.1 FeS assembly SUF system protein [Acidomonas methanolica]GBQ58319.1 metal-sulfur cluster biosynthetic enzyme [Acidomonas methanolica]GEK97533.1 SUF system Fe-S cluster assembly protein [Acidomonas methanolica NBRC 104435]